MEWEPISICGERKHLPDLLQCINDNRHLEQIRGAREAGFTQVFLVVEDQFREAPDGDVELYRKRRWQKLGFDYHIPDVQATNDLSRLDASKILVIDFVNGVGQRILVAPPALMRGAAQ